MMRTAPDGKEIKELPESAMNFLLELWARERNLKIISIEKYAEDRRGRKWGNII